MFIRYWDVALSSSSYLAEVTMTGLCFIHIFFIMINLNLSLCSNSWPKDCSPEENLTCTVYSFYDCSRRELGKIFPELFSGPGYAVPVKLGVYHSRDGIAKKTSEALSELMVFWKPSTIGESTGIKGYEISMLGVEGKALGSRRCFIVDTRGSDITKYGQVFYNFTIHSVYRSSIYHFRIVTLPVPSLTGKDSTYTVSVASAKELITSAPSEWTTSVSCEIEDLEDSFSLFVEYDLPPQSFHFQEVRLELVLDDDVIDIAFSNQPLSHFEIEKPGNYQVWVTPEDPYRFSPSKCLCRSNDDLCDGSCRTSKGTCRIISGSQSVDNSLVLYQDVADDNSDALHTNITVWLILGVICVITVPTIVGFGIIHLNKRKRCKEKKETEKSSNNKGKEHVCTTYISPATSGKQTQMLDQGRLEWPRDSSIYMESISLGGESV